MKRILISLSVIAAFALTTIGASSAFFSDIETSTNNILQAGDIDLTIDGENDKEGIVNFSDLKPGDNHIEEKVVRVGSNPAWVWFHIKDVLADQGLQTEPEILEENGVPKYDLNNYLTYDLSVVNEVLIASEAGIPFSDIVSCWVPLGELQGGMDVSVFQSFHLPSSVTNWAQGDRLTFTEEWYAEQSRNNPVPNGPVSVTGRAWSDTTTSCNSDLTGNWDIVFTCTSGCGGSYQHEMNILSSDTESGVLSGSGSYVPEPAISWDILNALAVGENIQFRIDYNNINPSYFVDLTGLIHEDGNMSGTAASNASQTFTWIANKI